MSVHRTKTADLKMGKENEDKLLPLLKRKFGKDIRRTHNQYDTSDFVNDLGHKWENKSRRIHSTKYETGFMNRYFCQRVNDKSGFVFEVSFDTFNQLKDNPYWKTAIMRWRLAGPIDPVYNDLGNLIDIGVKQSNKNSISITAGTLKNIGLYLPNILQFRK